MNTTTSKSGATAVAVTFSAPRALRRLTVVAALALVGGTMLLGSGCRSKEPNNRSDIERQNTMRMIEETHRNNPPDADLN